MISCKPVPIYFYFQADVYIYTDLWYECLYLSKIIQRILEGMIWQLCVWLDKITSRSFKVNFYAPQSHLVIGAV